MRNVNNIQDLLKDFEDFVDNEVNELALNIYQDAILMSPVDTGFYRGSWRVSKNHIDNSTGRSVQDYNAVKAKLSNLKGDYIYISNSVNYANELENGHSKQAPAGVLKKAIFKNINRR